MTPTTKLIKLNPLRAAMLAALLTAWLWAVPAFAATETVLHVFTGQPDGAYPYVGMARDNAGNLYGITPQGGTYNYGTIFELSPPTAAGGPWGYQILWSFTGGNDGSYPVTDLILDNQGALYGATSQGGATLCNCGVVYKLKPPASPGGTWSQRTLYHFQGGFDGASPLYGALLRDNTGAIYGTTYLGGLNGCGRAFKLTAGSNGNWNETVLLDFNCNSGVLNPYNGLIFDSKGNLFGPSPYGIFRLTPPSSGNPYWNFGYVGLSYARPDFVIDKYNVLYAAGYNLNSQSVIATLSPNSLGGYTETDIHTFTGNPDGSGPSGGVIRDAATNSLYGVANGGANCTGIGGAGVVYKLAKTGTTWTETILYSFQGGADGLYPSGRLVRDPAGNLYGVTSSGGDTSTSCDYTGFGTVFQVTP